MNEANPQASQLAWPTDDFSLAALNGVVDIADHVVHHVVGLQISDSLTVVTSAQQWAYALSFPLRSPVAMRGRTIIRVTGWVNAGCVGIGLVRSDKSTYIQEVFRAPGDGLTCIELSTASLEDCWAVVVRNAAAHGLPSKITIESIKAYLCLTEPTTLPAAVRWIESKHALVPMSSPAAIPAFGARKSGHSSEDSATRLKDVHQSTRPAVSLILTVKNGMPYLPQAIESLRRQEFRDFEVIVQNCLSTDGSLEHLETIDDLRISVYSEQDDGIGDAWGRAYRHCHANIVGSIDCDNLLKPDALSTVIAIFREYPQAAAVYGSVEMVNEDGTPNSIFVPGVFDVLQLLSCQLVPPWSTAFFSRFVCGDNLFFDESLRVCADFDIWLRISHLPILQTDKLLGSTRLSVKSMSCRAEGYDIFCQAKVRALERYVRGIAHPSLATALLRTGIAGIYCWAAESLQRLGASRLEILKFIDLALQADPASARAKSIQATL